MREILSPETSRMYLSVAAMLIESAAPLSILGICLVVTAAQGGPLTFAFGYVWSMFCVESKSSASTPKTSLTELCLLFLTVSFPTNDHPPGFHGPWMAQGNCEGDQHNAHVRSGHHDPRTKSGCMRDNL